MSDENLEEWDEDFLEQLIQVEELARSCLTQQPLVNLATHSPPRELSQRTHSISSTDNAKDLEINRLKKEVGRVSKQLTDLEHECFQLKKERNEKEELYKLSSSKNDERVANIHEFRDMKLKYEDAAADYHGFSRKLQNVYASDDQIGLHINIASSSSKAIGVQVDLCAQLDLSKNLEAIWGSPADQKWEKSLISELFMDCSSEFHELIGWMNINTSTNIMDSLAVKSSGVALQYRTHSDPTSEAAKVSYLCSVLMKVTSGLMPLKALIGPLVDLCHVENVAIVHKSLRILHVFLKHLLTMEKKAEERDNAMVEGVISRNNIRDFHGSSCAKNIPFYVNEDEASYAGNILFQTRSPDAEALCNNESWSPGKATPFSSLNWVSLFQLMHQIAMKNIEEYARSEAVSIMNMIVMNSRSYMEREKFGQELVLESISQLLKDEAGLQVQTEAVQLLYLLLNCPKVFVTLCSGCNKDGKTGSGNVNQENPAASKGFCMVLEGLADCIACRGNGVQDLKLRRKGILVLALLASSGVSGFEIIVSHKLCRETNFLMLILQVLVSEMDAEAADHDVPADVFRTRTLLIREALILLNRLVSNPACSAIVLRVLTASRDMASLTIDVANRLSRKDVRLEQSNHPSRQMRESEVVDLGRVFRKRVFNFLGQNMS